MSWCERALAQLEVHSKLYAPTAWVLMGPQGVGKSTLGAYIAKHTGKQWLDTDQLILEYYQSQGVEADTSKALVAQIGMAAFRVAEGRVLERLPFNDPNVVISLGGGSHVYHPGVQGLSQGFLVLLWPRSFSDFRFACLVRLFFGLSCAQIFTIGRGR